MLDICWEFIYTIDSIFSEKTTAHNIILEIYELNIENFKQSTESVSGVVCHYLAILISLYLYQLTLAGISYPVNWLQYFSQGIHTIVTCVGKGSHLPQTWKDICQSTQEYYSTNAAYVPWNSSTNTSWQNMSDSAILVSEYTLYQWVVPYQSYQPRVSAQKSGRKTFNKIKIKSYQWYHYATWIYIKTSMNHTMPIISLCHLDIFRHQWSVPYQ